MKLIARVLPPTSGRVIVRGDVAAMIALGAGFNPEMTARENIMLYGTLLGRDPAFVKSRIPEIVKWAGIEDFVDVPTRSFSSGMVGRLGFSVATDQRADVLVVDEVLSIGDEEFKRKSLNRMRELMSGGSAVVLVSHSLREITTSCTRALWLEDGQLRFDGHPEEAVSAYEAHA